MRSRSGPGPPGYPLAHAIGAVRRTLDELEVVTYANERPAVARQVDNVQLAEDCVNGAALEAELAKVAPGEQRRGIREPLGRRGEPLP